MARKSKLNKLYTSREAGYRVMEVDDKDKIRQVRVMKIGIHIGQIHLSGGKYHYLCICPEAMHNGFLLGDILEVIHHLNEHGDLPVNAPN